MTDFIPAVLDPEAIAGQPPYVIIGKVSRLLAEAGNSQATVDEFITQATSGGYDHVVTTALAWTEAE